MATQGIGGAQGINYSSMSSGGLEFDIEALLTQSVFRRMDAYAVQLRNTVGEMDARTAKLELLGKMSQAAGAIASQFTGTDTSSKISDTEPYKKMSSDDKKNIESDVKNIVIDGDTSATPKPVVGGTNETAENIGRAQDMKDNIMEMVIVGKESGLISDTDIARISKGDFKKAELDALLASIKTEQDKVGNENSKQQLALQSLTGRYEAATNLVGTLAKKFADSKSGVIQKT